MNQQSIFFFCEPINNPLFLFVAINRELFFCSNHASVIYACSNNSLFLVPIIRRLSPFTYVINILFLDKNIIYSYNEDIVSCLLN
jgi:hypothetical protein